ncbi:troponin I [Caerostris darwini]|uniref:Troponin I n=1 Tax=Caerostris darwini TaxID=1538125 RepID=A0AAV4TLA3_9ARAC|nr:troponin I [Caerostris darwini]
MKIRGICLPHIMLPYTITLREFLRCGTRVSHSSQLLGFLNLLWQVPLDLGPINDKSWPIKERKRVQEEKDRKKAEVRARLEAAAQAKKGGKKGFMTPARKKKLRTLLRKKAAEELKKEQERKAEERRRTINERCGPSKNLDGINEAALQAVCKEYYQRIMKLEDAKYDLEYAVRQKEFVVWVIRYVMHIIPAELMQICKELNDRIAKLESDKYDMEYDSRHKEYKINELNMQVNDLRGKFIKPPLKKVSRFEYGKFEKLMRAAKKADHSFRANLKSVGPSTKFKLDEDVKEAKPDWALGAKKGDNPEE